MQLLSEWLLIIIYATFTRHTIHVCRPECVHVITGAHLILNRVVSYLFVVVSCHACVVSAHDTTNTVVPCRMHAFFQNQNRRWFVLNSSHMHRTCTAPSYAAQARDFLWHKLARQNTVLVVPHIYMLLVNLLGYGDNHTAVFLIGSCF